MVDRGNWGDLLFGLMVGKVWVIEIIGVDLGNLGIMGGGVGWGKFLGRSSKSTQ